MLESFFENLSKVVRYIINVVIDILNHAISLMGDIVSWFKNKYKGLRRYSVYVITAVKLRKLLGQNIDKVPGIREELDKAITVHVPGLFEEEKFSEGVVETIVDNTTGNVTDLRVICGQGIDQDLKDSMKGVDSVKLV